jgi:hypothetical protein
MRGHPTSVAWLRGAIIKKIIRVPSWTAAARPQFRHADPMRQCRCNVPSVMSHAAALPSIVCVCFEALRTPPYKHEYSRDP